MAKRLVIVESPTKAKTIAKMLGRNYKVMASVGHLRDLPKSTLGIDTDNHFEPKYITLRGRGDVLAAVADWRCAVRRCGRRHSADQGLSRA